MIATSRTRHGLVLALALAALAILGTAPALAADDKVGPPAKLTVAQPTTTPNKGQYVLSATLVGQDGKPLNGRTVTFYQHSEVFGPREAFLGSGETDSTGVATLGYLASETGRLAISAHFEGDSTAAGAEAATTVEIHDAADLYSEPPMPFAAVRDWVPIVLGTLVLGTWAALFGGFLSTALGIRAAARVPAVQRQTLVPVPATGTPDKEGV